MAAACGTLAITLNSCNGCNNNRQPVTTTQQQTVRSTELTPARDVTYVNENTRAVNIMDSLDVVNGQAVTTERYQGRLPAADGPGIDYDLTIVHYDNTNRGVYTLTMDYIDADGAGRNRAFSEHGRYTTNMGTSNNSNERYISLAPFDGSAQRTNFVIETNNNLTLLGQNNTRTTNTDLNYTLTRVSVERR